MLVLEACGSLVLYTGVTRVRLDQISLMHSSLFMPEITINSGLSCLCLSLQVSKVFVPGLLSPSFSMTNHLSHLSTPAENVSTPANAGSRHLQRLEEVPLCVVNISFFMH